MFLWDGFRWRCDQCIRFSRPFSSPLHSISSVFNSISSGEAYSRQILSSTSSYCHSHSVFFNQIKKFSIQIRQLSLKFVCVARRVRNVGSNSSFLRTNSVFCHSNSPSVIGPLHLGDEFDWNFDENNVNRQNCFCCLVLSYCDRRIWIAVDENGWQSTKLNDNVSKLNDQRRNWIEHSHIPECPGRNWKHIF